MRINKILRINKRKKKMEFANKEYLLLLLLLIPYVLWYFLYRKNRLPSLRMSTTKAYRLSLIHI